MNIKSTVIGALLLGTASSFAGVNNITAHVGGITPGVGALYERNVYQDLWLTAGASYGEFYNDVAQASAVSIPVAASWMWGDAPHKLETGGGVTYISAKLKSHYDSSLSIGAGFFVPILSVGYRYLPEDSGLSFKATVNPVFAPDRLNWTAGIGLGYTF